MTDKRKSILMLIAAGIVWGLSFVVVKNGLDYITPLWQVTGRLGIAFLIILLFWHKELRKMNKQTVKRGIILGTIFAASLIFQTVGSQYTTASKCSFLTVSYVVFTPFIEIIFLRKKTNFRKIIAVVICMVGMGLLTLNGSFWLALGDGLEILCGLFYAIHLIYIDHCEKEIDVLQLHFMQIITANVICLVLALIFEPLPLHMGFNGLWCLVYCGIFEILLGFFLQMKGQQNTNPSLAGILLSMECVYGCIFATIFLHDTFTVQMVIGCVMIFISAILES